jgi:hypothetical protein
MLRVLGIEDVAARIAVVEPVPARDGVLPLGDRALIARACGLVPRLHVVADLALLDLLMDQRQRMKPTESARPTPTTASRAFRAFADVLAASANTVVP